jgi:hypothetical protein
MRSCIIYLGNFYANHKIEKDGIGSACNVQQRKDTKLWYEKLKARDKEKCVDLDGTRSASRISAKRKISNLRNIHFNTY